MLEPEDLEGQKAVLSWLLAQACLCLLQLSPHLGHWTFLEAEHSKGDTKSCPTASLPSWGLDPWGSLPQCPVLSCVGCCFAVCLLLGGAWHFSSRCHSPTPHL